MLLSRLPDFNLLRRRCKCKKAFQLLFRPRCIKIINEIVIPFLMKKKNNNNKKIMFIVINRLYCIIYVGMLKHKKCHCKISFELYILNNKTAKHIQICKTIVELGRHKKQQQTVLRRERQDLSKRTDGQAICRSQLAPKKTLGYLKLTERISGGLSINPLTIFIDSRGDRHLCTTLWDSTAIQGQ